MYIYFFCNYCMFNTTMTNSSKLLLIFLCVHILLLDIDATIPEKWSDITNTRGKVLFRVLNSAIIVPNLRQKKSNAQLKFSLGSPIVKVESKNATFWTFHLQDNSLVDFSIVDDDRKSATMYDLLWHGGGPNGPNRKVCLHTEFNNASWFDTYQPRDDATWPMKVWKGAQEKKPFNYLFDSFPEQVQELLFFNTDGFAVLLDQNQPLFIQKQGGDDRLLCFSVNNTNPYSESTTDPSYLDIKVHLYASSNIRSVSDYVISSSPYIPKPLIAPHEDAFARTSWFIWGDYVFKTIDYTAYLNQLLVNGFMQGEILDEDQLTAGAKTLKPNLERVINSFVEHNFKYKYEVKSGIWPEDCTTLLTLCDSNPDTDYRYIQAKSNFVGGPSGDTSGFPKYTVDFSNPAAVEWFASKRNQLLRNLRGRVHSLQVNQFALAQGANNYALHDKEYEKYPNRLISTYLATVASLKELAQSSIVSSQVAYKNQNLPVVVQLWMFGQWASAPSYLQSMITHALSVSIAGYSYFATNPIGSPNEGLTEELYIRWVQAATFMPHMTFYSAPWNYGPTCVNITSNFVKLHSKFVPLMSRLAQERVRSGRPIVRPMWYAEPENRAVYSIVDQFMVGPDLVVAPVLVAGQRMRDVHLPPGVWSDHRGRRYLGSQIVSVQVPLEELAFFERII